MIAQLLAQADIPTPAALASWLSVLFYIGGFVATVLGAAVALKSLREKKSEPTELAQPVHTKAVHDFATKPDLYALSGRMDEELGRERGARKKIHEEIGAIQSELSSLNTETGKQSADISEVKADVKRANERIDTVPERTIRLLRETKGLI